MQVCSQCAHTLLPEPNRPSGERRHCPHCKADLSTEEVPSELFDLPVPLRQLPAPLTSQAEEDALPVPLRPALDYRKERPKSCLLYTSFPPWLLYTHPFVVTCGRLWCHDDVSDFRDAAGSWQSAQHWPDADRRWHVLRCNRRWGLFLRPQPEQPDGRGHECSAVAKQSGLRHLRRCHRPQRDRDGTHCRSVS